MAASDWTRWKGAGRRQTAARSFSRRFRRNKRVFFVCLQIICEGAARSFWRLITKRTKSFPKNDKRGLFFFLSLSPEHASHFATFPPPVFFFFFTPQTTSEIPLKYSGASLQPPYFHFYCARYKEEQLFDAAVMKTRRLRGNKLGFNWRHFSRRRQGAYLFTAPAPTLVKITAH